MERREQVSALADGQLVGAAWDGALQCAAEDADARASWHTYHVIGDVLRSRDLAACGRDHAFVARLSERLKAESAVGDTVPVLTSTPESIADKDQSTMGSSKKRSVYGMNSPEAVNDSVFRWKLLAGMASMAAVMAVAWNGWTSLEPVGGGALLVQSGSEPAGISRGAPVAESPALMAASMVVVRDPRLDELLAAHRQVGGTSALQNPSGFLRNATFEGGAR